MDENYVGWVFFSPPAEETCGYCQGSGHVPGPQYDRDGRHRPDWPDRVTCDYCGGSGQLKDGHKLLPAREYPA